MDTLYYHLNFECTLCLYLCSCLCYELLLLCKTAGQTYMLSSSTCYLYCQCNVSWCMQVQAAAAEACDERWVVPEPSSSDQPTCSCQVSKASQGASQSRQIGHTSISCLAWPSSLYIVSANLYPASVWRKTWYSAVGMISPWESLSHWNALCTVSLRSFFLNSCSFTCVLMLLWRMTNYSRQIL